MDINHSSNTSIRSTMESEVPCQAENTTHSSPRCCGLDSKEHIFAKNKPFKCGICNNVSFWNIKNLNAHVELDHCAIIISQNPKCKTFSLNCNKRGVMANVTSVELVDIPSPNQSGSGLTEENAHKRIKILTFGKDITKISGNQNRSNVTKVLYKDSTSLSSKRYEGPTNGKIDHNLEDDCRENDTEPSKPNSSPKVNKNKSTDGPTKKSKSQRYCKARVSSKISECELCDKSFILKYRKSRHVESVYLNRIKLKCEFCDKVLTSEVGMLSHKKTHEKYREQEEEFKARDSNPARPDVPQCKICRRFFRNQYNLARHTKAVHSKEKPIKCPSCPKTFPLKNYLSYHIRVTHSNLKSDNCGICYKVFATNHVLKTHMRMVHKINIDE